MNGNELYRYVISQLNAGIPKSEIVDKLTRFARLSREDATNYVDSIDLQNQDVVNTNSDELKKSDSQQPAYKNKSAVQEFFELIFSAVILAVAFGIFLSGGAKSFSDPSMLIEISLISLLAVSLGFVFHEMGHRFIARKYGYIAIYSMWIPGLLLAVVTSFFSWIFAAPGAVMIRSREKSSEDPEEYVKHLGKISVSGPIVNICLALIFLLLSYLYIAADRFGASTPTLSIILVVGAHINSILAAFNLIPFGPFDGRKIFKWNKGAWFCTAAIAVGLFVFIQSSPSLIDNINAPKEPTSYKLYTDQNGKYSFNYPSDWLPLYSDSDSEWAAVIEGSTNMILFRETFDAGVIGIQTFDLSEDNPEIVIDKALLLDITDSFIKDIDTLNLIEKNEIVVDPLADEGQRFAYELKFQDSPENEILLISTFTYSDKYVYKLLFICLSDYSDTLMPAYNQLIESVRFK
jgi:Zn-dependent protease